jgi:nucleoside 2-deoxyribosyltransferase
VELDKPPYSGMTGDRLSQAIFALDRDRILEAEIFLFVLDGRVPDEGVCVELGIAYGQKHLLQRDKLLIRLHRDWRTAFPWSKLNAMVRGPLEQVVDSEDGLIAALAAYRQARGERREPARSQEGE